MFKRTTVVIPKILHDDLKIMAVLTNTSMQNFIRIAIQDKIKDLKSELNK